jgi:hypothetical protein
VSRVTAMQHENMLSAAQLAEADARSNAEVDALVASALGGGGGENFDEVDVDVEQPCDFQVDVGGAQPPPSSRRGVDLFVHTVPLSSSSSSSSAPPIVFGSAASWLRGGGGPARADTSASAAAVASAPALLEFEPIVRAPARQGPTAAATAAVRPSAHAPAFKARPSAMLRPDDVHECDEFFESPSGALGNTQGAVHLWLCTCRPSFFYVTVQLVGGDKATCFQLCPYRRFDIGWEAARAQSKSVVFMFMSHEFPDHLAHYCAMHFQSEPKEQAFVLAVLRAIRRDHVCAKFMCFEQPDGLARQAPYAALLAADQHGVVEMTAAAPRSS